ncbi:hypothetical protein MFFC18_18580 [Mariniblastus fucicola]|uniref:Uncharacterized protein n=1 Tax=Mariniblastus fucicola TaxID=980251 RepID=A0A5B9P5Z6_9BACT|nr:hypothetical protein MFFC18_18580 [Mariniblastus fucicola]
MFRFNVKSLFAIVACISVLIVVAQEPVYLFSIGLVYGLLCMSPLHEESSLTTAFHDAVVGLLGGLIAGIAILLAGSGANADDFAWHVSRFLNSSFIGATFAFVCSALRQ